MTGRPTQGIEPLRATPPAHPQLQPTPSPRPSPRSIALIVLAWLILQIGGLFSPGLLDDVDSIYIEVAREMLHRHDFVTPYIDGIRFFDKPPLMYWLAAGSMRLFGEHDWAARLPLALCVLALLLAVYALALRLYAQASPAAHPDRAALYAALALATAIGPYLYTRFFIPDILIALWMTLSVHLFLIALDRTSARTSARTSDPRVPHDHHDTVGVIVGGSSTHPNPSPLRVPHPLSASSTKGGISFARANDRTPPSVTKSSLLPCLLFAATLALNLLTKGLIGLVFPIVFALLYLLLTRQLRLLPRLHLLPSTLVFLAVALPWHLLAALRNPSIDLPPGLALPARAGWAWFYLYNEHIARFLGQRIPHDYGQTPVWLFWLYALLWIMPWGAFLPAAIATLYRHLGHRFPVTVRQREAALVTTLWALIVLVFFTLSSRQEYYSLPALPALALLIGGLLALADTSSETQDSSSLGHSEKGQESTTTPSAPSFAPFAKGEVSSEARPRFSHPLDTSQPGLHALLCHRWILLPLTLLVTAICAYFAFTAPQPAPGTDLAALLATNPELYNLSLGHLFDLTAAAMGLFRGPLIVVALGMLAVGLGSYLLRRSSRTFAANLTLAAGMIVVLLAAHEALIRFSPILGSKGLAQTILAEQATHPQPDDLILIDGELTSGSSLLFDTQQPVHLVNGRINGPWFGSFWPDAPPIFETEASLRTLWQGPHRIFLLTYDPRHRTENLAPYAPVRTLSSAGGKTILTNR